MTIHLSRPCGNLQENQSFWKPIRRPLENYGVKRKAYAPALRLSTSDVGAKKCDLTSDAFMWRQHQRD